MTMTKLTQSIKGLFSPKVKQGELVKQNASFAARLDYSIIKIVTIGQHRRGGDWSLTTSPLTYCQSPTNEWKIWCRTEAQKADIKTWSKLNTQYEDADYSKYRAQRIGELLKYMEQDEAEEVIKRDFDRIKFRFWAHPPQKMASHIIWCEEFELHQIRSRVRELREERERRRRFEALINIPEIVPYYKSQPAFGAGFYPAIHIRFLEES